MGRILDAVTEAQHAFSERGLDVPYITLSEYDFRSMLTEKEVHSNTSPTMYTGLVKVNGHSVMSVNYRDKRQWGTDGL